MTTIKKNVLMVGFFLLGSLVLITSEGERKESVMRDLQGNVVPFPVVDRAPERQMSFVGATTRYFSAKMSPFERWLAIRKKNPIAQLPHDAQANIAGYLEQEKYDLWKTLNTPAGQLAFRDNGQHLVSLYYNPYTIFAV